MSKEDKQDYQEVKTQKGGAYYYFGDDRMLVDLTQKTVYAKESIVIKTSSDLEEGESWKERPVYHKQVNMRFVLRESAKKSTLGLANVDLKYRREDWVAIQDSIIDVPDDKEGVE